MAPAPIYSRNEFYKCLKGQPSTNLPQAHFINSYIVILRSPYLGGSWLWFGESVLGVRRFGGLLGNMKKKKSILHFPTTKGSLNACMELVGFSASNKDKNHYLTWTSCRPSSHPILLHRRYSHIAETTTSTPLSFTLNSLSQWPT